MTEQQECNCKESTCIEGCARRHTHKSFFCEICEPEACKQMEPSQPQPTTDEWTEFETKFFILSGKIPVEEYVELEAFFHSRFLPKSKVKEEIESMEKKQWIIHGRDCEDGRRPCGGVRKPKPLADRCELNWYDDKTLTDLSNNLGL